MSNFSRSLDDAFVDALNAEYEKGGWWHRFVHDSEIFVAIRNDSVNALLSRLQPVETGLDRRRDRWVGSLQVSSPPIDFPTVCQDLKWRGGTAR